MALGQAHEALKFNSDSNRDKFQKNKATPAPLL